ncbi:MAG: hypothetical protein AW07_04138 [Candidatus Accumulibacter sp. SK-11]|nr:MAG: hypothetical protein AW07_04138 [Candidatus Accumulibacter sp. SK-11]
MGVLLMKGETTIPTSIRATSKCRSLCPASTPSQSPSLSTRPVLDKAPLMMNRQAMVIGALLANTPSTSPGLRIPSVISTATATMAATSGFSHSRTKVANSTMRTRLTAKTCSSSGSNILGWR